MLYFLKETNRSFKRHLLHTLMHIITALKGAICKNVAQNSYYTHIQNTAVSRRLFAGDFLHIVPLRAKKM